MIQGCIAFDVFDSVPHKRLVSLVLAWWIAYITHIKSSRAVLAVFNKRLSYIYGPGETGLLGLTEKVIHCLELGKDSFDYGKTVHVHELVTKAVHVL